MRSSGDRRMLIAAGTRYSVFRVQREEGVGMASVLVTYATKTGCTRGVAERIGAALGEGGASVDVVPAEDKPDPSGYDAVVLGSGVRAGSWHGSASGWLKANAAALQARPVALFTACLTMAQGPEKADEVRAYTAPLLEETGVKPVDIGLFAGWFEPKEFGFVERAILKGMKSPQGDFRDWDAIDAWARDVAAPLGLAG